MNKNFFFIALFVLLCGQSLVSNPKGSSTKNPTKAFVPKIVQAAQALEKLREFNPFYSCKIEPLEKQLQALHAAAPEHNYVKAVVSKLATAKNCNQEALDTLKDLVKTINRSISRRPEHLTDPHVVEVKKFCNQLEFILGLELHSLPGGSFFWWCKKHPLLIGTGVASFAALCTGFWHRKKIARWVLGQEDPDGDDDDRGGGGVVGSGDGGWLGGSGSKPTIPQDGYHLTPEDFEHIQTLAAQLESAGVKTSVKHAISDGQERVSLSCGAHANLNAWLLSQDGIRDKVRAGGINISEHETKAAGLAVQSFYQSFNIPKLSKEKQLLRNFKAKKDEERTALETEISRINKALEFEKNKSKKKTLRKERKEKLALHSELNKELSSSRDYKKATVWANLEAQNCLLLDELHYLYSRSKSKPEWLNPGNGVFRLCGRMGFPMKIDHVQAKTPITDDHFMELPEWNRLYEAGKAPDIPGTALTEKALTDFREGRRGLVFVFQPPQLPGKWPYAHFVCARFDFFPSGRSDGKGELVITTADSIETTRPPSEDEQTCLKAFGQLLLHGKRQSLHEKLEVHLPATGPDGNLVRTDLDFFVKAGSKDGFTLSNDELASLFAEATQEEMAQLFGIHLASANLGAKQQLWDRLDGIEAIKSKLPAKPT